MTVHSTTYDKAIWWCSASCVRFLCWILFLVQFVGLKDNICLTNPHVLLPAEDGDFSEKFLSIILFDFQFQWRVSVPPSHLHVQGISCLWSSTTRGTSLSFRNCCVHVMAIKSSMQFSSKEVRHTVKCAVLHFVMGRLFFDNESLKVCH